MHSKILFQIFAIAYVITLATFFPQVNCDDDDDDEESPVIPANYFTQDLIDLACKVANETISNEAKQESDFLLFGVDKSSKTNGGPSHYHAGFSRAAGQSAASKYYGRRYEVALGVLLDGLNLSKQDRRTVMQQFQGSDLSAFDIHLACAEKDNCVNDNNCVTCDLRNATIVRFRTANGVCNNIDNPLNGSAVRAFERFLPPQYENDIGAPKITGVNGKPLPSARLVSRVIHTDSSAATEASRLTHMVMQWSQYLDHDITATPMVFGDDGSEINCCERDFTSTLNVEELRNQGVSEEEIIIRQNLRDGCFPIDIPQPGDPAFDRTCMNFVRSQPASPDKCMISQREQRNDITAYIDSSNVYGSSIELQNRLRAGAGGLLAVTPARVSGGRSTGDLLPQDVDPDATCVIESPGNICFKAGDGRNNEFISLTAKHTLWLREHNRVALELAKLNRRWTDERLFQEAKRIIDAYHQKITYGDFLPIVLGSDLMADFDLNIKESGSTSTYDPEVNAGIKNEFATAAYRMGHSYINSILTRVDENFNTLGFTPLMSGSNFFRPAAIYDTSANGPNSILLGLLVDKNQRFDRLLTTEVTARLFETRFGGRNLSLDLAALNIQRGRDHGLPGYLAFRRLCDLPGGNVRSFRNLRDITDPVEELLAQVYDNVEDIDLFTGGMSEIRLRGAQIGPTFGCLLARQFDVLKRGDRFYFENDPRNDNGIPVQGFTEAELREVRKMTISRALCNNVPVNNIQPDAFRTNTASGNRRVPCSEIPQPDLSVFNSRRAFLQSIDGIGEGEEEEEEEEEDDK